MERVAVPLGDLHAGTIRDAGEGIGKLANPAAGRGNHATLTQFPASDITSAAPRSAGRAPKAEGFAGFENDAVDRGGSDAKILHLAKLELLLARIGSGVQPVLVLGEQA